MNGIVLVEDIFSLYVFVEIAAIGSFILIAMDKDFAACEGAFKYIILSGTATIFMLSAVALLLLICGGTSFSSLSLALSTSPNRMLINLAVAVFLLACFIKSGLMPFHGWLPDAYSSAPPAVSVLLAGIVTKAAGVYTLIRLVAFVFGFTPAIRALLLVVGALSVVAGALAALGQKDFKRMLAYSSISQVGYIVLGLGCGTPLGIAGAVFHLFNHAVFKSLLFLNSAAVESATGTRDLDRLAGLNQRMPLTGITSLLASLSCAGIPPLAGFWSKLIIIVALWMTGAYLYAGIAIAASVLTLAYFLSLQRKIFFGQIGAGLSSVKEAGLGLAFPAVMLALLTLGAGLFFPVILRIFILPAGSIAGG
jgi:multicomponent Na+:H+ antiporter subunit D